MIILIFIIGYALYKLFDNNQNTKSDYLPLEILKTKFVQGEISEDEYLRRKKIIQSR